MQYINLKKLTLLLSVFFLVSLYSCKIDPILDPNNPSLEHLSQNPTRGELQNLVTGIESQMRIGGYYDVVSIIGRDYYRFDGSEPRYTSDLTGQIANLDPNTFYTTGPYRNLYLTIKNANILIDGLNNTTDALTAQEKAVGIAYAKTIIAYELHLALNLEYDNGIRVDVADPNHLGPFLSRADALAAIIQMNNDAYGDLNTNASVKLPFHSTLVDDDGAGELGELNRALAARYAIYAEKWSDALTALNNSFFDLNGDLNEGPDFLFSTAGGDQLNPLFLPRNSVGIARVVSDDFENSAEAGDSRLNKVSLRNSSIATSQGGAMSMNYDFWLYKTNVDPIPMIRNEELILIYAEANIRSGNSGFANGVNALNIIRSKAGLSPYSGAMDEDDLINEMLQQRRYSLFGEGHRWVDMRRYNRLNQIHLDRTGDKIWSEIPRPAGEQ